MNNHHTTSELVPVVESNVFVGHEDFRFALGKVAVNNIIVNGYENEFAGAAKLRANTYLDSGFINPDDLNDDGTELDENDFSRSVHFIVLERMATASLARVVGNMRLVIKSKENPSPLPIESYCEDVFSNNPIPIGGLEVSRLIARHEDGDIQNALKWPLFVAGYKYVEHNKLGPAYGLLAPGLTRHLRSQHIPIAALADERFIEHINATKQPTSIDLSILRKLVDIAGDQGVDVTTDKFSYLDFSEFNNKG